MLVSIRLIGSARSLPLVPLRMYEVTPSGRDVKVDSEYQYSCIPSGLLAFVRLVNRYINLGVVDYDSHTAGVFKARDVLLGLQLGQSDRGQRSLVGQ